MTDNEQGQAPPTRTPSLPPIGGYLPAEEGERAHFAEALGIKHLGRAPEGASPAALELLKPLNASGIDFAEHVISTSSGAAESVTVDAESAN